DGRPTYGPTITQRTDFNFYQNFLPDQAFILEDASYAPFLAWFVEGVRPRFLWIRPLWRLIRHVVTNLISGKSPGTTGFAFADLLKHTTSSESAVLLCMGMDSSNGVMELDADGHLSVSWPWSENRRLYDAILDAGKEFKKLTGAKTFAPLPTWN